MAKCFYLLLLFIGFAECANSCKQETLLSSNAMNVCDSVDIFLKKLLEAKIQYEKDLYHNDSSRVKGDKKVYFDMVATMKIQKETYLACLKRLLEKEEKTTKMIKYVYYPSYISTIPKCGFISYKKYLLLLKYNLEHLSDEEFELKCEESILSN